MNLGRIAVCALAISVPMLVDAAGGGGGSESTSAVTDDPTVVAAKSAIAGENWLESQRILSAALVRNPANADYHNLYAYSIRKGPKPDMDLVFKHYSEALRIDPKHLGAHEYLGEAYLSVNNLAKAKEQLAALDRLCFFGCEEYSDLKLSIKNYESKASR